MLTLLPSGSLKLGYMLGSGCLCDQPQKNHEHCISNKLPWVDSISTCCHHSVLEELSCSDVIPLGEDSWKIVPGFLYTSPHVSFPFAAYALYPFALVNLSCECTHMLSPEPLTWGWSQRPHM